MRIQYVSTYISMSKEGLVEKFLCPVDQSLLFSNQDIEENIFLYCLSCKYKKNIGLNTYKDIVKLVEGQLKNDRLSK
jgi:DNA-directed RNA polymerase subunit M/transcription elongation factor TFIIS